VKTLVIAVRMLLVLSIVTGLIYPLVITGLAQAMFSAQAKGSMIEVEGRKIGSHLIGQSFSSGRYFWPRPSAVAYNPLPSGGSNLGSTSAAMSDTVSARAARLGAPAGEIPADLLLASGSGLDPDISPEAAFFQVRRVLTGRGRGDNDTAQVRALIQRMTQPPLLGMLGEPRVNVLRLNLALDSLLP